MIGLIVLFTAAAGLVARHVYADHTAGTGMSGTPHASSSSSAATDQTESRTVVLSADASGYPQSAQVQAALQHYFDGINQQDYQLWTAGVTKDRLRQTPLSNWKLFASTTDSDILVRRIEAGPDNRLIVLLTFRSVQSLANAPKYAQFTCILWNVVWPFAQEGGVWKLDVGDASKIPAYADCSK